MPSDFLRISPKIRVLPIIHGSGDCALEVRRVMLSEQFDCLAVPLPPSFQCDVEAAIEYLPTVSLVMQRESLPGYGTEWTPDADDTASDPDDPQASYVPIDPCQGVIAGLRIAIQEHMHRAFIDLETEEFVETSTVLPDPYALKQVPLEKFAAGILPAIPRPRQDQVCDRIAAMGARLRGLERRFKSILLICSLVDWPWIREAYTQPPENPPEDDEVFDTDSYQADPKTLAFMLGELPFITGLYERARAELDDDENLSIDGVKELLLVSRKKYRQEFGNRARPLTPHLFAQYLKYVRNLSLVERRLTPDLYTLVIAAQQFAGDQFAMHVAETARDYPYQDILPFETIPLSIGRARLPDGDIVGLKSRLPGSPVSWRTCELQRRPDKAEQQRWEYRWDPYRQCSWPPEDVAIENFRTHVKDQANAIIGADLARSEKFNCSIMDGLDIRETLRNWHTGDLYVKVIPPSRGGLDCVVMLFDSPADPRDYPWRVTWMAEHHDESTLALFATDYHKEMVGPGIGMATYGGAMFLFPPRPVPDIWMDPRLDFTETLEERLVAAACLHSNERHIALLSPLPPGPGWRRLAKKFRKRLVHVPLGRFSQSTVQQLRLVHVLNGQQVRSYASHFIRKA
ncbi:hypothetical protein Pan258_09080 [Symmachiella dynata]|uniref:hypothetical protein n=1 Tax=Symmachiella dynata TaxID=2527995 RepID=UPI0011878CDF|nr:hypothetical protein [Symmachiella dynata]QDT46883.1 hypothetical protein Pan258_09080 [Symmachiella dynata]